MSLRLVGHYAIFDGTNFNTIQGLDILSIDAYLQPRRSLSLSHIARSNKNAVNSGFYTEKLLKVRVRINRATRELTEQSIDALNAILQGLNKELIVPQAGNARKYYCSLQDVNAIDHGGANWEAELIFALNDMFGYDINYTTILNMMNVTSISRTDQYTFDGSADFQAPRWEIYYSAVTSSTGTQSVIIGNNLNGQSCTIARTFSAGERLVIDGVTEKITVNDVEVEYTGAIPKFAKGTSQLTYLDNFSSRTFNYFVYYYKRYI